MALVAHLAPLIGPTITTPLIMVTLMIDTQVIAIPETAIQVIEITIEDDKQFTVAASVIAITPVP
jgi:hypothetical protein